MKTEQEHLEWCKKRALQYIDRGEITQAYASMASDMKGHEETKDHPAIILGVQLLVAGLLSEREEMRKFILGFN